MDIVYEQELSLSPPLQDDKVIPELLGRCMNDKDNIHQNFVTLKVQAQNGDIIRVSVKLEP